MKNHISWVLLLVAWCSPLHSLAQSNLLSNGSFEGDLGSGAYPRFEEHLYDRNPSPWFQFNQGGEVRWFTDSTWTYTNWNPVNPDYQNGHFKSGDFDVAYPWHENGPYQDSMYTMAAHTGRFYVGFDARSDGFNREGIQTPVNACELNSGSYEVSLYFARPYLNTGQPHIFLSLSDQLDDRRYIFDEFDIQSSLNSGQWYYHSAAFQIDLDDPDHVGNDWFSITGRSFGNSDPRHYAYFDDVRLHRPCDDLMECIPTHGQVCPSVATPHAPGDLLRVSGISNARDMRLKVSSLAGQVVKDTTYHNANGLPDFRFTRLGLPVATGSATYQYTLEITNACGGVKRTGNIQVLDTSAYNPVTPYVDSTADWTGVPIPCCLSSITLQNMQIVGDVSYIVRDMITVQGGVSLAPGSDVTLQAGQVVELSDVDFDGSVSSLEIVEIPCPQRCAQGADCGGGSMLMDAGRFVIPAQGAADTVASAGAIADMAAMPVAPEPAKPSEPGLWAHPNPFRQEFQVGFALDRPSTCTLVVSDMQMRPVRTSVQSKELPAGVHRFTVDMRDLPSGVYVVQLQAGGRMHHRRMVKQ